MASLSQANRAEPFYPCRGKGPPSLGRTAQRLSAGLLLTAAVLSCGCRERTAAVSVEGTLAVYDPGKTYAALEVRYPADQTVWPPDLAAPTFRWEDDSGADEWVIRLETRNQLPPLVHAAATKLWMPEAKAWEEIKQRSRERPMTTVILGRRQGQPEPVLSKGQVTFRTSADPVGAPVFYREVILPFITAVKDPARIRWRFGPVSSPQPPPVVLEGLPVCGNCHSFSRDGRTMGMDVDYANNKGSYVVTPTAAQMALLPKDIITWDDFRREDGEQTFGLLSQVSPDGQVVVSTVKDRSVFVPKPDLEFSQLFFPLRGILAVYDRRARTFRSLPGADDPQYVQSNPSWSPDGRYIVFARANAYHLKKEPERGRALLTVEECEEFVKEGKPFQFDLYRVPYNGGQGGQAEPLRGASRNGKSNFFPRYSPDGKWIVFCMASNYMLLQPDSELYMIPAEGGAARRLEGNTGRMNSWHSWSPNGRWLVFSSKANSPYTQLWLTHLDEQGNSSPAVCLEHFTSSDRAANIPEFVPLPPRAIEHIEARFLNDYSHARAGFVCEKTGEIDRAIAEYRQALSLNPANTHAHERLGYVLYQFKRDAKAGLAHSQQAVLADPKNGQAHYLLGIMQLDQNDLAGALDHLTEALRLFPTVVATDPQYTPAACHNYLGLACLLKEDFTAAARHLTEAAQLRPRDPQVHFSLAAALAHLGQIEAPWRHYQQAIGLKPELDQLPQLYDLLAANYARAGRFPEAVAAAKNALTRAQASGQTDLLSQLQERLRQYQSAQPGAK